MKENTPSTTPEMLAALADGELDLRDCPDALAKISADSQGAQRIAFQQQLRRSVASAMDGPSMRCPDALRSQIESLAISTTTHGEAPAAQPPPPAQPAPLPAVHSVAPHGQPAVIGRIGRWAPAAVAAVLLIAATAVFFSGGSDSPAGPATPILDARTVQTFGTRHMHCADNPADTLKESDRFGHGVDELPTTLDDYFSRSVDGVAFDLSAVQYDYQLAGVCNIPGSGAVHLVYRHHDHPERAMSLWIVPANEEITRNMQQGRVYVETATGLDHPVILWEDNGLIFYLVGDSLEDVQHAVETLRPPA
ncbi:hypothetical protein OT109_05690 [Phycisphaeraceae bacterium D3-23]